MVAFSRNRISNESIKAVPNFVGVVDSISGLHKLTFDAFSSHTQLGQEPLVQPRVSSARQWFSIRHLTRL